VLGERVLGEAGTIAVSFLGGFVSSASATAAAGSLTAHHGISARTAAICTVLASVASALVNLPILYRSAKQRETIRRLIGASSIMTAVGLVVLAAIILLTR